MGVITFFGSGLRSGLTEGGGGGGGTTTLGGTTLGFTDSTGLGAFFGFSTFADGITLDSSMTGVLL
jgi:hypothetical protein